MADQNEEPALELPQITPARQNQGLSGDVLDSELERDTDKYYPVTSIESFELLNQKPTVFAGIATRLKQHRILNPFNWRS